MDHTADFGECTVEREVSGSIGRGTKVAFDYSTVGEADDNHVGSLHGVVAHTAGLDNDKALLAVDTRHVAPCEYHEAVLNEAHIGTIYFFFKFFEHEVEVFLSVPEGAENG